MWYRLAAQCPFHFLRVFRNSSEKKKKFLILIQSLEELDPPKLRARLPWWLRG